MSLSLPTAAPADGFAALPAFAVLAVLSLGLLWFTAHRTLRSEAPA